MRQIGAIMLCAGVLCAAMGCTTSRITTTERTAVEQALLSQVAEQSVAKLLIPAMPGQSYFINEEQFEAVDGRYILALLNRKLLKNGMNRVAEDAADILIYPHVANAGIDEKTTLVGIPEVPIGVPGLGSITLPEVILYGSHRQMGRNRMSIYGKNTADGSLAFVSNIASSQRQYTRWQLLFLISFRTTDLDKPF